MKEIKTFEELRNKTSRLYNNMEYFEFENDHFKKFELNKPALFDRDIAISVELRKETNEATLCLKQKYEYIFITATFQKIYDVIKSIKSAEEK